MNPDKEKKKDEKNSCNEERSEKKKYRKCSLPKKLPHKQMTANIHFVVTSS